MMSLWREYLVEAGGNAQRVLEEIPRAQLAVQIRAVPVIPLVERHADVRASQRGNLAPVGAVRLGNPPDLLRNLQHVAQQPRPLPAVEMLADEIHLAGIRCQHRLVPLAHGADGHELDRAVLRPHRLRELLVLPDVIGERHVAELPVAVHLVADRPPPAPERRRLAVLRAEGTHGRRPGAVDILDFVSRSGHIAETAVDGNIGLGSNQAAQRHEFVNPDVVRLDPLPRRVLPRRPPVTIAEAVPPVVPADEVPAGPPVDGGVQLAEQGEDVRPESFHVVRRHQRDRANPVRSGPLARDLQAARIGGVAGGESQSGGLERGTDPRNRHGLTVRRRLPPHEAHGNRGGSSLAGQNDPADVPLAGNERERALRDARARTGGRRADLGRLRAAERRRRVLIRSVRGIANGPPRRLLRTPTA